MSLDTEKLHRLRGKGFNILYNDNKDKYGEMVENARAYAQTTVGENEIVRVGDVVAVVENAVRIDPSFEQHLGEKKLTQRFWVNWYAEYIVEKSYPQPDLKPIEVKKKGGK